MNISSPSILVTGATGFIGRHMVEELENQGERVLAMGRCDVDLAQERYCLPQSIHTIYHFAGQIWGDEEQECAILENVIEMAKDCDATRIVYASSCSVYGRNAMECKTDENVDVDPLSPYAQGKLHGEKLLAQSDLATTILRFFNPYGVGQFAKMVVPNMVARAKAGLDLDIFGNGEQVRDFIYIRDMVQASVQAAAAGGQYEIFNIGSGEETTIRQLAEIVKTLTGSNSQIVNQPVPAERQNLEVSYRVADISKIKSVSGWSPQMTLKDGLGEYIARLK